MTYSPNCSLPGRPANLDAAFIGELLKRVPTTSIVAGVRSPDHEVARQFSAQGVEIRVADYARPDTLSSAFEGIGRLLMISSTAGGGNRVAQHRNAINAAKAANVGLVA